jgi:bifunctional isochorismate lyase/aryl carrier protein
MALPRIASYPLPTASDIVASRLRWTLGSGRAALLIHDTQNYFIGAFEQPSPMVDRVIENINALRAACNTAGIPVFYTAQPGHQDPRDRGLQADFWGPGMSSDPSHRDIDPRVAPVESDIVLTKWRYSAFQRTPLEPMLRARGRDQLIVTGVFAHIGCLLTAADAFMRDIQPFFVADAVGDFSRERHDHAVTYAGDCCAAVVTTAQAIRSLQS